jgi:hypothetical protein
VPESRIVNGLGLQTSITRPTERKRLFRSITNRAFRTGLALTRREPAIVTRDSHSVINSERHIQALWINGDVENGYEATEVLWEMAARADFPVPAEMRKILKRKGVVTTAAKGIETV